MHKPLESTTPSLLLSPRVMRELVCPVGNPSSRLSWPLHFLWTPQQEIERHILPNGLHHMDTGFSSPSSAAYCPCSPQLSRSRVAYCPVALTVLFSAEHLSIPVTAGRRKSLPLWQSPCWKSPNWFWKKEIIDQKSLATSGESHLDICVRREEEQGLDFQFSIF